MTNLKIKGSQTLLDGGSICLDLDVDGKWMVLKLDRCLGTATPDHLYVGNRCLKPYSDSENRIIVALVDALKEDIATKVSRDDYSRATENHQCLQ